MTIHQFSRNVIAAIATLVFSTSVGAQAIIFQPVNTPSPIPTMSVVGMILLSLVIVGVAIYFRRRQATLMSLALAALGLGLFASQNDVIRAAWAAGFLTTSFESGQTEALLNKGPGQYEVTNTSGGPIRITGFTGDGEACSFALGQRQEKIHLAALDVPLADLGIKLAQRVDDSVWRICPNGADQTCPEPPSPGCTINSQIAPGDKCYVVLQCNNILAQPT